MTRQELKLIRKLNKLTSKSEIPFFYDISDSSVHLQDSSNRRISCEELDCEINALFQSLIIKHYITTIPVPGVDTDKYCLTHKGIHFAQFTVEKIISFLIKSIFVPVLVAALTTLITMYIKGQL